MKQLHDSHREPTNLCNWGKNQASFPQLHKLVGSSAVPNNFLCSLINDSSIITIDVQFYFLPLDSSKITFDLWLTCVKQKAKIQMEYSALVFFAVFVPEATREEVHVCGSTDEHGGVTVFFRKNIKELLTV